ncbi:MAG TPA: hypothetical protein PKI76_04585 [Oscillospiraceae bacterium]|nr:hypothetical protein [Oscillospiraceae bacterium]HNW04640.1 hypothetical protein [Oscillospiraceae bacterium]
MKHGRSIRELDAARVNVHLGREPEQFVSLSESRFQLQINDLADRILSEKTPVRVVLISGPSATGKTTAAEKLRAELGVCGKEAAIVSVDDFFLGAGSLPRNPDGTYDMDTIGVVDTELARRSIGDLLARGEADFPVFDFSSQRRSGEVRHLSASGGLVVIEGTHALNPLLTEGLPRRGVFRVFTGTNARFCVDGRTLLTPEELRLARRMVRDEQFRGWPAERTLAQWPNILRSSDIYIEPYAGTAEFFLDSALDYEPAVYGGRLFPMLERIAADSPYAPGAEELRRKLSYFSELSEKLVPKDSLLREFIG